MYGRNRITRVDFDDCSADTHEAILMLSGPARSALEMIYGNDRIRRGNFSTASSTEPRLYK
jgi:hypothetical protein